MLIGADEVLRDGASGTLNLGAVQITTGPGGLAAEFSLRRLDRDRDLDMVHSWMNDSEVAQFWKMPWSRAEIASYLHRQDMSTHSIPYVGVLDGTPMSYWELYRADLDPLAQHYAARES